MRSHFSLFRLIALSALFAMSPVCLAQEEAADLTDVRLVIDVSGSMKRNDPNNLRQPAVELLVELLPEESRAGVWTFGKWVNMLIPHREVNSPWRDTARAEAKKINSVGLFTNIGAALEKAAYDISYVDKNQRKNIILLTDGMVDIDKQPEANRAEWRRIVDEVIPKLKQAGYTIHTIALSKNADRDLMNKISVATDGVADIAYSAEDLMKIFLKAFDAAVPAEQVSLDNNRFVIDSSVEEFTALIFRRDPLEQTRLSSPDNQLWDSGSETSDVRWHRTDRYDLITVKRPLEGTWIVEADMEPDSRVTVVSNLNLRVRPLPNNVLKGAVLDIDAYLQEDGQTITDADFLSLMSVDARLLGGADYTSLVELWQEDMARDSSRFVSTLPPLDKEGVYQVRVFVDGKTFTREYKRQITLRQAFSADVREEFGEGRLNYVLTVNAYTDNVNFDKTQVVATIVNPDKRRIIRPLALSELDSWLVTIQPDLEGEYRAVIQVKGESLDGDDFVYTLDELSFNYSIDGGLVSAKPEFEEVLPEEPEPEPEPTPTPEATAEPAVVEEPKEVPVAESGSPFPDWVIYVALGVGNLILLLVGFLAYKKIMGGGEKDVMSELDEAEREETAPDAPEPESELESEIEPEEETDEDEEEPPMEDLDPDAPSPEPAELIEPEEEPEILDAMEEEIPMLEPEADTEPDDVADLAGLDEDDVALDVGLDEIDDLDAMAMEESEEEVVEDESEEDDDMVTAMLKAQGLDLAEEELDDAISSLIDDLEDDERDSDEDKEAPA